MSDYDHYERHEAMESADDELQAARARIAELEATLARVRELAIEWPKRPRPYGTGEFIRDECAYELEAALAPPVAKCPPHDPEIIGTTHAVCKRCGAERRLRHG